MLFFLLIALTAAAIALYAYALHHSKYWRRRGIPGPPSRVFTGNLDKFWGSGSRGFTPMHQLQAWSKEYGKVYGMQEGWSNTLVVSDLNMLQEMFVTKFDIFHGRRTPPIAGNPDTEKRVHVFMARGARWKRLRAIGNPVFSVNNLKQILPTMDDSVRELMRFLDEAHERQAPFNIHPYFHELTMDVIARIAMGQKESRMFRSPYAPMARSVFEQLGNGTFSYLGWLAPGFATWLKAVGKLVGKLTNAPFTQFICMIEKAVAERKRERKLAASDEMSSMDSAPQRSIDFIDLLLDAESKEVVNTELYGQSTFDRASAKIDRKLTTDEVAAMCFVFLLAGFDTTANTLACTCYELADRPEVMRRLQQEIDEQCPDGEPTYEQLNQLKFADAVMKETLRLYPIAAFAAARTCSQTTTLGDYTVEKGTVVMADVYSCHRSKEVWGADADEFRPQRWLEEGETHHHPMAWIPFGAGPRTCIGMRLAYLEEKLALVYILRKYNIKRCAETEKELWMKGSGVLNPTSVTIQLEQRE